mgnify:FL=1
MTLEKCMLFAEEYPYSPKENDLFMIKPIW